jgi:uncharacterized protein YneR
LRQAFQFNHIREEYSVPKFDYKSTFHGTSAEFASDLVSGKVDTSTGGGELGQGFYVGTELHVAKAWAKQKFDCETVVEFKMNEEDFWGFDIEALSLSEAIEQRESIKARCLVPECGGSDQQ